MDSWQDFEDLLKAVGMRKTDLGVELGIHRETISRWRRGKIPTYAWAYLDLRLRLMKYEDL